MGQIHISADTTLMSTKQASPDTLRCNTIFTSQNLYHGNFNVRPREYQPPDWTTGILILCFILVAWTQTFYNKRIRQVFKAPFSKRFTNQLTRDGNLFKERISVSLGIVYILCFSLLLYEYNEQILKIGFPKFQGVVLFGLIALVNIVYFALKVALVQTLGIIFKTRETTFNYLLNMLIFALLSGPAIMVYLVFILYLNNPIVLHIGLIFFILTLVFKFVRGLLIGIGLTKFSYLFLFVYLCSLEILPLLVFIKFLLNQAQSAGL